MSDSTPEKFQPMPDLAPDQLAALREDIAANGVIVPVVVDQHGRVLDGHNRRSIAAELGIDCPTVVQEVADDQVAMDVAVALNCARRHVTQAQKRDLIRDEIVRRPDDSDRAIARRVGCDHKTVGAVRTEALGTGESPHPDRAEVEARLEKTRALIDHGQQIMLAAVCELLVYGITPYEIAGALTVARNRLTDRQREAHPTGSDEDHRLVAGFTFDPVIEWTLNPKNTAEWIDLSPGRVPDATSLLAQIAELDTGDGR